jgi:hypothetical protein
MHTNVTKPVTRKYELQMNKSRPLQYCPKPQLGQVLLKNFNAYSVLQYRIFIKSKDEFAN